jgi:multicomponent Na+:H+ antiporter subunit F
MITVVVTVMGVAIALAAAGLVLFRATSRKVVVLDVLTTMVTGALVVAATASGSSFVLDIALVYAILSFAAVLVVARYLERGI